jgi:hypothetical protein
MSKEGDFEKSGMFRTQKVYLKSSIPNEQCLTEKVPTKITEVACPPQRVPRE